MALYFCREVRNYILLGGMPEVITAFLEFGELERTWYNYRSVGMKT